MEIEQLSNEEYTALDDPRPHRFPGRDPSDSCYCGVTTGGVLRKCRCQLCREAHNATTRNRQQAQREGLWVDGRRAIRTSAFLADLTELAVRVPELYALLRKHGHVPAIIRLQAERVIAGELPHGTGSQPADAEAQPAQESQTPRSEGREQQAPAEAGTEALRLADELLRRVRHAADASGYVPLDWISATSISRELGVPVTDAQAALSEIWGEHLTMGGGRPRLTARFV